MRAIDRKLLRDLKGMRGQAIAIGFVIVAGVASFVGMTSIMETLEHTLETYYDDYRFPDAFAQVTRAPEHVSERLREVPGIGEVQTRVTASANLEVEGFDLPVTATIHSMPEGRQPVLNRLYIREGRLVEPGREDEVLLSEQFAEAHDLHPGDEITAIIRGSRRALTIVGIVLTPEHLWQVEPGAIFPDPETYGVMWMGRLALAAAYDMEGAFNDIAFTLAPGASLEDVLERVDLVLERYGGLGAFGRDDHPSHMLLRIELDQLQGMATLLPIIFLAVAAFLLNIVVMRMIALQREQIAVLKAFGYRDLDVGMHYLKLVLLIALMGTAGGVLLGVWLGRAMADLYLEYFRFPELEYALSLRVILVATVLTTGASVLGVVQAVRRAIKLPPAEAMRPAPPATFRPTFVERLGLQRIFNQPTRIIMRNIERQPVKALFTVIGISVSGALLIMGLFFNDAFDKVIEVQYGVAQREDITVSFVEPTSSSAAHELRSLPGVIQAEPFRVIPVRLRNGHHSYQTAIEGVPKGSYLRRVIDERLRPVQIPPDGLVLAQGLADILRAAPGDVLTVEMLEGRRRTRSVPVVGVTTQYIGIGAYMDLEAANRLAGGGSTISGAFLMIDPEQEQAVNDALRERPRVASIVSTDRAIRAYREESAETMLVFAFILSLFAGVIAFGVVYNSIRISLSERDRELASLRVLGFTRGEIAYILLGEAATLVLLAIPLGFLLGSWGAVLTVMSVESEIMSIPVVLTRQTYALSAVVVLASALLSAALIGRKIRTLDLIGVLKTRE
jgi:putative ABC transport system permease protein